MAIQRAYTGAWRNQNAYVDRALPPGPGVDPAHSRRDLRDPDLVPPGQPRVDQPPMYITEDPDDAWEWEVDTPGLTMPTDPLTHDANDPQIIQPAPISGAEAHPPSAGAHAIDRGAVEERDYTPRDLRQFDETWETTRWEQPATQGDLSVAMQRGTNSLPANNPPTEDYPSGYRLGFSIKRFMNRNMFHDERRHDERILFPAGAAAAVQSPAVTPAQYNRYVSPLGWNVRAAGNMLLAPVMRREPVLASEDATTDGTDQPSGFGLDWVVD
jgi:hypothetical protein